MRKPPAKRKTRQSVKPGLRGFAEARKANIDLLKEIQTHVTAEGTKNAGAGRESHKIHVSELVKDGSCPRHMFYKITEVEPTDPAAPAYHRLEMIWAAGNQEHAKWQRWLQEMELLWGTWLCRLCEHSWQGDTPRHCPNCGEEGFISYEEVDLEVYPLVGHADGAVPSKNTLVEVKSFSVGSVRFDSPRLVAEHTHKVDGKSLVDHEGLWNAVKRPLKSHLVQGLMYLWMCREMGLPYDKILFIYENKTTQATKTFEIKLSVRQIQEFLDMLDDVMHHVELNQVPDRPALYSKDSKPCNHCIFRTRCWDGEQASAPVPVAGPSDGGEEAGRAPAVHAARKAEGGHSRRTERHHRSGGPGPDSADEGVHGLGRASRRAVGDGRGGRAVGRSRDGEGEGSRAVRRSREGRNSA